MNRPSMRVSAISACLPRALSILACCCRGHWPANRLILSRQSLVGWWPTDEPGCWIICWRSRAQFELASCSAGWDFQIICGSPTVLSKTCQAGNGSSHPGRNFCQIDRHVLHNQINSQLYLSVSFRIKIKRSVKMAGILLADPFIVLHRCCELV